MMYDLMVLTAPQAAAEGKEKFKENVDSLLSKQKVKVVSCDEWGERALTYPIKKYDRGMYYVYVVDMEASRTAALETKLRLESGVLRHILVKQHVKKAE